MISGVELYFSLGVIFVLAIFLSSISVKNIEGVFLWIMIIVGIFVYTSIFDLWTLILCIIINIIIIGIKRNNGGNI